MSEDARRLSQFEKGQCISIETLRRSGQPVRTPVWFAYDGSAIYIRTLVNSGKAKRMRNNPSVRVVICSYSGAPKGEWVEAEARVASADESRRALALLDRRYNFQKWATDLIAKILGREYTVFVIRPR